VLSNQTLLISKANLPVYFCHTCLDTRFVKYTPTLTTTPIRIVFPSSGERCVTLNLVDPKYSASKTSSCGEFVKGPLIYMITDDLVVTPMSYFTAISYLNSSNVPMFDMEERVIRIGLYEVIIHCIRLLSSLLIAINLNFHTLSQWVVLCKPFWFSICNLSGLKRKLKWLYLVCVFVLNLS
jgi:hypothetical protein